MDATRACLSEFSIEMESKYSSGAFQVPLSSELIRA